VVFAEGVYPVEELWLRCPCSRNLAKVVQEAAEVASPRGYNGYTHRGLWIIRPSGVDRRAHGAGDPGPDRTDTFTCKCRSQRTRRPTVHTMSGRRLAQLWDENIGDPSRVVRVTIEYR
jgi:hypothetical protein